MSFYSSIPGLNLSPNILGHQYSSRLKALKKESSLVHQRPVSQFKDISKPPKKTIRSNKSLTIDENLEFQERELTEIIRSIIQDPEMPAINQRQIIDAISKFIAHIPYLIATLRQLIKALISVSNYSVEKFLNGELDQKDFFAAKAYKQNENPKAQFLMNLPGSNTEIKFSYDENYIAKVDSVKLKLQNLPDIEIPISPESDPYLIEFDIRAGHLSLEIDTPDTTHLSKEQAEFQFIQEFSKAIKEQADINDTTRGQAEDLIESLPGILDFIRHVFTETAQTSEKKDRFIYVDDNGQVVINENQFLGIFEDSSLGLTGDLTCQVEDLGDNRFQVRFEFEEVEEDLGHIRTMTFALRNDYYIQLEEFGLEYDSKSYKIQLADKDDSEPDAIDRLFLFDINPV